jgi:predicted nuclease of predicted toxin-antitoxin system
VKLLFDENVSPKLVDRLTLEFPGSAHVRDVGLRAAEDHQVWEYARAHAFAIVSKDTDFRERSFVEGFPPKIIWLDVGNAGQPKKLMESMIAVLNFRASNEPTSLGAVVNMHRHMAITPDEVDDFRDAFLDTLHKKLPRSMAPERKEKILGAWRDLFSPVVEYFKEELQDTASPSISDPPQPATSAATAWSSIPAAGASRRSLVTARRP